MQSCNFPSSAQEKCSGSLAANKAMATPAPSSHEFRKLRLDTKHKNSSQDFPFAASSNADHVASSQFSSSELLDPDGPERDEQQTRTRGSSVSFKEYATLDDGRKHSLDQPLPRPRRSSIRDSCMATDASQAQSASAPAAPEDSPRINPFTGEPIRRRTRRSEVAPRLETIDSNDTTHAHLPSLTSASSGSLLSEQLRSPDTPSGSYFNENAVMSPSPAVSPSMGSEPWPMLSRNKTLSRTASLRNTSRRSSRMSGSSMSPAAQFLNGWGRSSQTTAAPEPDDEGQSIGINNEYVIGRKIGSGGFSVVKEVIGMSEDGTRTKLAVKIVRKSVANTSEAENDKAQQAVEYEIGVWRYMNHPHVIRLHTSFITDFATFCIMDLVESGSLYDLISELRNNGQMGLKHDLARKYAFQLASAIRYIHEDVRLIHRDVKLENCLVQVGDNDSGVLKLCDFGLACFVDGDSGMTDSIRSLDSNDSDSNQPAGTLEYLAPELLGGSNQRHYSSDIWAFGVCVYTMITGKRPFAHTIQFKLVELIESGQWNKDAIKASPAGQESFKNICALLQGCLNTDPDERWCIKDVMNCSWFAGLHDVSHDEDWEHVNATQS
ncbi:kinase-like protein [Aureobasidium pullulans]|nr:kinase-like protein [Aureobasidium pullulans]